ncbi:UDP-N-acetylmuramate--L-alanine ligase [Demequina sp. TTPB684]|uniref:UDP-N-acetylmuramate--L-alanine ligase n=1 Tax=unclassified Demequina TaxID=2620311 RepID=UPI001CF1478B|nr:MULTISPECIES: UDP-N-acetylmuramate--L-alanine ligase [unclassified Demequina]MCB2412138.1 UDP-N-acetylmuramate--L-alanine ligase [Demequina sp. TTPB684]UPU89564.1 UDP-N-acetylmuramate--L-alanine ligase [Demequina sp. TMPB413]
MRFHFIGVGGSGMSAVARLVAAKGVDVTGSDKGRSAYFAALEAAGADVRVGHDANAVAGADVVVISTAVRETNEELARARELGIDVWHRSEALAWALEGRRLIAVAGSHGKTTTSALTAHILHACGVDASYAVGARVFGVEGAVAGGYGGTADLAVVEADESDGSFLKYATEIAILLNVEPDHLDFYGSFEAVESAFVKFAAAARVLVACVDDPGAARVADAAAAAGVRVVRYGVSPRPAGAGAADVVVGPRDVTWAERTVPLSVPIPGVHQRLNAAAAWCAVVEAGVEPVVAAEAVASFAGTGRRFELRGESRGMRVIDDYAHHPTEVAAVLAAARADGAGRLVVLFQPALFSRTQALGEEFGRALSIDNAVIILAPVHGDREDPIEGVTSQLIADTIVVGEHSTVELAASLEDAAARAAAVARPGDTVMTVGSGTVTQAAGWILDEWRRSDG